MSVIFWVIKTIVSSGALALRAWILTLLWSWFIVAQFHVSTISFVGAVGISLIASFLTAQYIPQESDDAAEIYKDAITFSIALSLISLLSGYVAHLFM